MTWQWSVRVACHWSGGVVSVGVNQVMIRALRCVRCTDAIMQRTKARNSLWHNYWGNTTPQITHVLHMTRTKDGQNLV